MPGAMISSGRLHPAVDLLAREKRVRRGLVPRQLDGVTVPLGSSLLAGNAYLLRTHSGYGIHYRKGEGITVERSAQADQAEENLWLNGSVHAAIAAINGFLPFHASAVAFEGKAHAFSGPSGAGKSTLAAGLGRYGLPLHCDDTLVLDISDPRRVLCLPGHKRLKLTDEAIALTGAAPREKVAPQVDKHYADPAAGCVTDVLPLASLTFLEEGEDLVMEPIRGAARIARINDDHYTAEMFAMAHWHLPLATRFARIATLAEHIPMQQMFRSRDPARFDAITAEIARRIKERRFP